MSKIAAAIFRVWWIPPQVPSEAQKIDLTNEVRAKSEVMWRSRLVELMEDLEASKVSIHGLLQVSLPAIIHAGRLTKNNPYKATKPFNA